MKAWETDRRCFACGRAIKRGQPYRIVYCADDQEPEVGLECAKHIKKAGVAGYQPKKGGPRLFWTKPLSPSVNDKGENQ